MKSVLITGGTGFFGRAFVRRLLADGLAERICIYSRDEFKQATMRRDLGDDGRLRWFIGDARDRERLGQALRGVDTVIHAAALKRIEVGFYNPSEMIKTNVLGTMNLVDQAAACGVARVLMLSTDKACRPVSAYGYSKALAESLVLAGNHVHGERGPAYAVTRYGNVAGSTGSVIPTWRAMAAAGAESVPLSDPEVTRFWMSEAQAVDLVLETLRTMTGGELAIPTLPAYRLGDLAEAMGLKTHVVGLGEYEKRHESMREGESSEHARRMSVDEIREGLAHV